LEFFSGHWFVVLKICQIYFKFLKLRELNYRNIVYTFNLACVHPTLAGLPEI
jgi:hypothetical protein